MAVAEGSPADRCYTCHGLGEVTSGGPPETCPDCFGEGVIRHGDATHEWRLRAVERHYTARGDPDARADVLWLVTELRRSREALVRILARCQDAAGDGLARDIMGDVIDALGTYKRS